MKTTKRQLLATTLGTLIIFASLRGWTKVEFDSNVLMMKTADEISEMVRKKIKRAQEIQGKQEDRGDDFLAEPAAVAELRDAMRIVLSRPDQDGTRSDVFSRLRRELSDLDSFDKTVEDLSSEAVAALKSDSTAPNRTLTYIVLLENLMAEIKPEIQTNAKFKHVIESIRDAKIKISDKTKNQALMRSMSKPTSPSETAAKILPKGK